MDLSRTGWISRDQARTALKSLAASKRHEEEIALLSIPDKVDETTFTGLAVSVLKIAPMEFN